MQSRSSGGVQNSEHHSKATRPQGRHVLPQRFHECEVYTDEQISDEGDLVHITMFAGVELIGEIEALKKSVEGCNERRN